MCSLSNVSCVVFYSYPFEASLTGIFRSLELCCCSRVYVISSLRHRDEVSKLCELLNNLIDGIEFIALPIVPDVENTPERISEVMRVLKGLEALKGRACFTASAGSRLEVASYSSLIRRSLTDVIYVSFLWGPWVGTYYPFAPKPIQVTHILHPGIESFRECGEGYLRLSKLSRLLSKYFSRLPRLRYEVLSNQLIINAGISSKCIDHEGINCRCGSLVIKLVFKGEELINYELSDYCSWSEVVKSTEELSKEVNELCINYGLGDLRCSLTTTLINVAGIRLLVIDDYVGTELSGLKGYSLTDAMELINDYLLIDTNVVYGGIHNYLHENPVLARKVVVPLSTYVEMYEHQVHVGNDSYRVVRAELSKLLINELSYFKPVIKEDVVVTPSEVGIATTKDYIAVTSDRRAFNNLYKWLGRKAILTKSEPVAKVKFKVNEWSRRVSYSYYAVTQLRALSKLLRNIMSKHGIYLEVNLR